MQVSVDHYCCLDDAVISEFLQKFADLQSISNYQICLTKILGFFV
jgi:hypothetical protein